MTANNSDFESSTKVSGDTLVAGNANAYSSVSIGAGSSLTYSNAHPARGTLAMRVLTASGVATFADSTVASTSVSDRFWIYVISLPTVNSTILTWRTSVPNQCGNITLLTTGRIQLQNNAGSNMGTTTAAMSASNGYWIQAQCFSSATVGFLLLKLLDSSGALIETLTPATNNSMNTRGGNVVTDRIGKPGTGTDVAEFHIDNHLTVDGATVYLGLPVTVDDFATAADTVTVATAATAAETASAADAVAATAANTLAETAVATDALAATVPVALADTGSAADGITKAVSLTLSDTAAAVDAINVAGASSPTVPDTAAGADAVTTTAAVILADTGAAADLIGKAVALTLADTGTAVDVLQVVSSRTLADSASAVDAVDVLAGADKDLPDTAAASDGMAAATVARIGDNGTAADGLSIVITITLADVAQASDLIYRNAPVIDNPRLSIAGNLATVSIAATVRTASIPEPLFAASISPAATSTSVPPNLAEVSLGD